MTSSNFVFSTGHATVSLGLAYSVYVDEQHTRNGRTTTTHYAVVGLRVRLTDWRAGSVEAVAYRCNAAGIVQRNATTRVLPGSVLPADLLLAAKEEANAMVLGK